MKTNLILLFSIIGITLSSCASKNSIANDTVLSQNSDMQTIPLNIIEEIVFSGSQNYDIVLDKSKDAPAISGSFKTKLENKKLLIIPADNANSSVVLISTNNLPNIISNGSGNIRLSGKAERAVIYSNGSGDIDAEKCKVKMLSFYSNGSGDSKVYASSQANVILDGSGNVVVKGSPKLVNRMGSHAYNIK